MNTLKAQWNDTISLIYTVPLTLVSIRVQVSKEGGKKRRHRSIMLEEVEQDIDGETAEEVDAVGTQEGRA